MARIIDRITCPAIPAFLLFLVAATEIELGDLMHVDPVQGWCPVVEITRDDKWGVIRTTVQASRGERITFARGIDREFEVQRPNPAKAIAELPRVSAEAAFDGEFDGDFAVLTF